MIMKKGRSEDYLKIIIEKSKIEQQISSELVINKSMLHLN